MNACAQPIAATLKNNCLQYNIILQMQKNPEMIDFPYNDHIAYQLIHVTTVFGRTPVS